MEMENNLVKICSRNCKKCVYHSYAGANICCVYILMEGVSRIFEKGEKRDIPKGYCDRYIRNSEELRRKYNSKIHSGAIKLVPKEETKC